MSEDVPEDVLEDVLEAVPMPYSRTMPSSMPSPGTLERARHLARHRVVHVLPHLQVNGGVKVALQQAELLTAVGVESIVAVPHLTPSPFPRYRARVTTWDAVEPRPGDVVIAHWPASLHAVCAADPDRRHGRRIYHAQACFFARRDARGRQAREGTRHDLDVYDQGAVLDPAVELFAVSREVQRYFLYAFGRPSHRVHNWVDTRLFTPAPSRRVAGRVGLLRHRDYAGTDEGARLERALRDAGLDVVTLHGSELEVAEGLQRCELFVAAARGEPNGWRRSEGFQLPTAEAMACGCVVVGLDTGGVADYLVDGVNGLLVEPGDARDHGTKALVEATVRAAHRPDRTRLAACAAATIRSAFSRERILEQLLVALTEPPPPPIPAPLRPRAPAAG